MASVSVSLKGKGTDILSRMVVSVAEPSTCLQQSLTYPLQHARAQKEGAISKPKNTNPLKPNMPESGSGMLQLPELGIINLQAT